MTAFSLVAAACSSHCDEEQAVAYQTWQVDAWDVLDELPAEPPPVTPAVEGVVDTAALDDLAAGMPRGITWLRVGTASNEGCGPYRRACNVYELIVLLTASISPGEYALTVESGVPTGMYLTLYSRDHDITEPDPGRDGGRYFENTPAAGTMWVDEFGPDVKLRYDVTFDNGEGRVRHVVGSLETDRSVQCVAD